MVEHPAAIWRNGVPSIWRLALTRLILSLRGAALHLVDQCQLGLEHRAPTHLLTLRCFTMQSLIRALPGGGLCDHGRDAHERLVDRDGSDRKTAAKRLYPSGLGRLLATAMVDSLPQPAVEAPDLLPDELAQLRRFDVAIANGDFDMESWRDLDSAPLRGRRAKEEARAARKQAALRRHREADPFVEAVMRDAGEQRRP